MGTHGDNVIVIIGWAIGSFFLAVLLLFGLMAGLLVGLLLIPLLPLAAIGIVVVHLLKGAHEDATLRESEAVEASALEEAQPPTVPTPTPIVATVVETGGVCPMGQNFQAGQAWTLNGKWSDGGPCPRVVKLLSEAAGRLRSDQVAEGELLQCLGKEHRVVFQLRTIEEEWVTTPVQATSL